MSKDPAFLFYPGDYLRDTQTLSEKVQVAYDRIMCEHMRKICITQAQLVFFTKRLSPDEVLELKSVLSEDSEGFFIAWVRDSISKRKAYSKSRADNRIGKTKKDINNISLSHDKHMDNENEIKDLTEGGKGETRSIQIHRLLDKRSTMFAPQIAELFTELWLHYPVHKESITDLCADNQITIEQIPVLVLEFIKQQIKGDKIMESPKELRKYFANWLPIYLKNNPLDSPSSDSQDTGYELNLEKKYGPGGKFHVPKDKLKHG